MIGLLWSCSGCTAWKAHTVEHVVAITTIHIVNVVVVLVVVKEFMFTVMAILSFIECIYKYGL